MPMTSAPPSLQGLSVLLSDFCQRYSARYHSEISLHLFWSRNSRRCVQAPLGNDESCSWQCPWQLLAADCQGKLSPEQAKCLHKSGVCLEPVPALKQKNPNNNPSPQALHQYYQIHIIHTMKSFSTVKAWNKCSSQQHKYIYSPCVSAFCYTFNFIG